MKYLGYLSIALVTFAVGVTLTRFATPTVRRPPVPSEIRRVAPQTRSSPDVQISLRRFFRDENGVVNAEFDVLNRSAEPLFYLGYSKGDHEQWTVRRGNRSQRYSPFCGTGLKERLLAPNESAKFTVFIGPEGGDVQVGFDF